MSNQIIIFEIQYYMYFDRLIRLYTFKKSPYNIRYIFDERGVKGWLNICQQICNIKMVLEKINFCTIKNGEHTLSILF